MKLDAELAAVFGKTVLLRLNRMLKLQRDLNFARRRKRGRDRRLAPGMLHLFGTDEFECPVGESDAVGCDIHPEVGMLRRKEGAQIDAQNKRSNVLGLNSESHFGDRSVGPDTVPQLGIAP